VRENEERGRKNKGKKRKARRNAYEGERKGKRKGKVRKEKKKRKKENEWGMCHHVGGWEKMRLSSPSQFGDDMWQGGISFFI